MSGVITEMYRNHLLIFAIDHFGNKQIHVYRPDGLRIIDTAEDVTQAKRLIDEDIKGGEKRSEV